jgi:hypothetical protein
VTDNVLARLAYERGISPLDWAEGHVNQLIDVHIMVWSSRLQDPATFPGYPIELTTGALARRIIGELLDAGWTLPEPGAPPATGATS